MVLKAVNTDYFIIIDGVEGCQHWLLYHIDGVEGCQHWLLYHHWWCWRLSTLTALLVMLKAVNRQPSNTYSDKVVRVVTFTCQWVPANNALLCLAKDQRPVLCGTEVYNHMIFSPGNETKNSGRHRYMCNHLNTSVLRAWGSRISYIETAWISLGVRPANERRR